MGTHLQRLFSTFAGGWPGAGLLLLRLVAGTALLYFATGRHLNSSDLPSFVPQVLEVGAGILLLVGLWTPIAGAAMAMVQVWIAFSRAGDPLIPLLLAALGLGLAMIGPGAWSIDARLFGRKQIKTPGK